MPEVVKGWVGPRVCFEVVLHMAAKKIFYAADSIRQKTL